MHNILSQLTKPNQVLSTTRILHALIIKTCLSHDPFYPTKIIRFYAINGDLLSARNLFDENPNRSVYMWNSIIRAYAQGHRLNDAFVLFKSLLKSETRPDNHTFACIARACADRFDVQALRIVHDKLIVFGLGFDCVCSSALVSCYSKLGLIHEARCVFRGIDEPDLVLCNAMILGFGDFGDWGNGIELFKTMQNKGIRPDGYTMVGLITGLVDHNLLKLGETVHGFCVKCGLIFNNHVGSTLVTMYSKCMDMDSALSVFYSLLQPDLVSWSALIVGVSAVGDHVNALVFFRKLVLDGFQADHVLLASVLSASAHLTTLRLGCEIHGYAIRHRCDTEVSTSSALIDMYAKCGFLEMGIKVFENMPKRNIVSFNTLISNLGLFGRAGESFLLFEEMLGNGLKPDEATFAGLLCACCHAGLVNEGREYFRIMSKFGIEVKTEHHVHLVKLLGMNGKLEEAYDHINSLPGQVDSSIWGALLSCCDSLKDYKFVEVIAENVLKNESNDFGFSVMVSNLLAGDGRWDDVKQLRADCRRKMPGISWMTHIRS